MTPNQILSEVTIFNKYAKYIPELQRRENWTGIVDRNLGMHITKFPQLTAAISEAYQNVYEKKALPSMRSLQFGGRPIDLSNSRIFNCAYMPVERIDAFSEAMFLLLGGTGLGYSVQSRHVEQLPPVRGVSSDTPRRFLIGDSIEGWSDAIKVLMEAYFLGKAKPVFDYRDIRDKGEALITTGGKAPGPEPLRICIEKLTSELDKVVGRVIKPIEAHDFMCIIADAVLAGGIRRAAMISLFDMNDGDMLTAKSGEWWVDKPYRARANNSVTLLRGSVSKEEFEGLMKIIEFSGAGEPGIYWTDNLDWGTNPCCEIALPPYCFCNLTEVNVDGVTEIVDLESRVRTATILGTLQATYTDFHYIRPIWKQTTEEHALLGVGATGIASCDLGPDWWSYVAEYAVEVNAYWAQRLGINTAARVTTVKPSGTSSLVLGTSSGVHAWHAPFYIRRMRAGMNEALTQYLLNTNPRLVAMDEFSQGNVVLEFPQKAPAGAVLRSESMMDFLDRVLMLNLSWIAPGHNRGDNKNNVSCTVSVKPEEWGQLTQWMWTNRAHYNGISLLPYDGGTYVQAPFEDITEDEYNRMVACMNPIVIEDVLEVTNETNLVGEAACAGGACER